MPSTNGANGAGTAAKKAATRKPAPAEVGREERQPPRRRPRHRPAPPRRRRTGRGPAPGAGRRIPEPARVAPDARSSSAPSTRPRASSQRWRDGLSARRDDGDPALRHDAGITDDRRRDWVRSIKVEVGVGMFGRPSPSGEVGVTGDYPTDPSFVHFPDADRLVRDIDDPLVARRAAVSGGRTFGAMGTFSSRAQRLRRPGRRPRPSPRRPRRGGDVRTPTSSSSSAARGQTSSDARRRSGRYARSAAGSSPCVTPERSCSAPSTRPPAS